MTQVDEAIERLRAMVPQGREVNEGSHLADIRYLLAEVERLRADMHKLAGYDFDTAAKIAIARAALQPQGNAKP